MYIVHQCFFTLFILLHFENLHHKWAFRYSLFHLKLRIQQRKGLYKILSSPMSKLENTGKMSRLLIPQFHPPVSPWCDVPMALNYVNCLPNQPVYEAAADQWERSVQPRHQSEAGRPRPSVAAQFPPTNIATVELSTVFTSDRCCSRHKYATQFMDKNSLITRILRSLAWPPQPPFLRG